MEESVLLTVGIDQNQIADSISAIQQARKELDALKKTNKELSEESGNTSKAFIENEVTMKRLNQSIKENERVLVNSQKIVKSNEGSIVSMRESIKRLSSEYVNLSSTERNAAKGRELEKKIKAQNDEVMKLEKSMGDFKRNVGNYPQVMGGAVAATDTMGGSAIRLFDVIKANPIVFLVTALVTLISKISESQAVMDALNKVITPINVLFQKLVGIIQDNLNPALGFLTEAFENPKQALVDLGNLIVDNVLNRFKALALFGPALKKLFSGDIAGGFKDLGNATLQLSTGVEDMIGKVTTAATAVGKFISEAVAEGQKLNEINIAIEKQEAAIALQAAALNRELAARKNQIEDINTSEQRRIAAGREALALIDEESKLQQDLLNLKIQKAQLEASFNDTDRKAQLELNKLIAERDELEARRLGARKEVLTKVAGLEKAQRDKEAAEIKRLQDEQNKAFSKQLEERAALVEKEIAMRIEKEKQRFVQGEIDYKAYQDSLLQIDTAANDVRIAANEAYLQSIRESKEIDDATRVELERKFLEKLGTVQRDALDADVEATKVAAEEKVELEQMVVDARMTALNASLNALMAVLGAESAAGKAVASVQALVNTYEGITKALTLKPPFSFITAAATAVMGFAQVARINSTPSPQLAAPPVGRVTRTLAEGGAIDIGGEYHSSGGTYFSGSDGTTFEAEKGEKLFVVNRKSSALLNALEAINNYGRRGRGGRNFLADGGFVSRGVTTGAMTQAADGANLAFARDVRESVGNLTVVARISEINRVNADLTSAMAISEL